MRIGRVAEGRGPPASAPTDSISVSCFTARPPDLEALKRGKCGPVPRPHAERELASKTETYVRFRERPGRVSPSKAGDRHAERRDPFDVGIGVARQQAAEN